MTDIENKIKITHISRYAYPKSGGIESFINMFNTCIKADNLNIEVLCCSNSEKSSVANGVKYTRCKYLFEFASNNISTQFLYELHKVNTDIIIYHMPFIFAVISHFIARPKYKKMIVCYHSDIIGYDRIMKPFWKIYNLFLKKSDIIHVQSPQMLENSLIKNFKHKSIMIPYLTDTNCTYNSDNVLKIRNKYQNKKIIFSLGRHVKYKGFIHLIKAMKQVEDAVLLLGGIGYLSNDFKKYIEENQLNDKVFMLGNIPEEKLNDYYEACDIFVLSSVTCAETFAVVQLEAMLHSKPIINTNLGTGVNYVSIDEETGLTVEAKNSEELAKAINKLLNDDILRKNLGNNARIRAKNFFDIEKLKNKYMALAQI